MPIFYDLVIFRMVHRATLLAAPYMWLLVHVEDSVRQHRGRRVASN